MDSMENKVLAGMIPYSLIDRDVVLQAKRNLLNVMRRNLSFTSDSNKLIFNVIASYFKATQNFPDTDIFTDILKDNQLDEERMTKAIIQFDSLSREQLPQEKVEFYIDRMASNQKQTDFKDVLVEALDTLGSGDDLSTNTTALDKAKALIVPKLFDSAMISENTPHGDITKEKDELLADYEEAKRTGGVVDGLKTGIRMIDAAIEGMVKGQLIVIGGASGEGKSWLAANIGWYNTVVAKKNVVVITAETLRSQYRRRVITRHSNLPKFGAPLEFNKIKTGKLSEEEEEVYQMVVDDFTSGQYGSLEISQVSNGTTLGDIRIYLEQLSLYFKIDLVILDYLTLLKPTNRRSSQREEAVELLKEAKQLAVTFNKGEGIPLVTLHQISTQAREKAKWAPGKCYTLGSLADSSEAGKSADIAFALLRTEEMEQEHELGVQILKTRDSAADDKMFKCFENYQYAYLGDLEES